MSKVYFRVASCEGFMALVNGVPSEAGIGAWCEYTQTFYHPDLDAIEQALPYKWRKAWQRIGKRPMFWVHSDTHVEHGHGHLPSLNVQTLNLFGYRGKYLTRIKAVPCYAGSVKGSE